MIVSEARTLVRNELTIILQQRITENESLKTCRNSLLLGHRRG